MKIITVDLPPPAGASLHRDYLSGKESVRAFFRYSWDDPASLRTRARFLAGHYRQDRERLAGALAAYNSSLEAGTAVLENIALLRRPDTLVVVGGQQPGLCTGPLYTIYKAITTIILARRATAALGVPVVPCFWVASEDHDFEEVNRVYLLDREYRLRCLELSFRPEGRKSAGHVPVGVEGRRILEELDLVTPATEFKGDVLHLLELGPEENPSLAGWFARIMSRLFTPWGLVMVDPMLPEIRQLSAPVFQRALELAPEMGRLLEETTRAMEARGYRRQVEREEGQANLFIYLKGERTALFREDKRVFTRSGELSREVPEMLDLAGERPDLFSPNVVLRPVVQDYLLPTVAQVTGPHELVYLAQMGKIYGLFGMEMPVLFPRLHCTLVEPRVRDLLERYGLEVAESLDLRRLETRREECLAEADRLNLPELFRQEKERIAAGYRELIERVRCIDEGLFRLGEENLGRILAQVAYLEGKALQRHRQAHGNMLRHFQIISDSLCPEGRPQERVLSIWSFLVKYGRGMLAGLLEGVRLEGYQQICYLNGRGGGDGG